MKRSKVIFAILIASILTACGEKEVRNNSTEDISEITLDVEAEEVDTSDGIDNIVESQPDDYISAADLKETDVLELCDKYLSEEKYEDAGGMLYRWLKLYDSDKVQSKLDEIKDTVYISGCTATVYDMDDNVIYTEVYVLNEYGDLMEEQYISDDGTINSYVYQYIYDNGVCVSELCCDESGNVVFNWEATMDKHNNILSECTTRDNGSVTDTIEHTYDNGLCVQECEVYKSTYDGEHSQTVKLEYDGELVVKESYYDETDTLIEEVYYEYDDSGNNMKTEYYSMSENEDGEPYLVFEYEYDDSGNVIKSITNNGEHNEHTVYSYDKFGNCVVQEFYQHDELNTTMEYEHDFLGNVVISTAVCGDDGTTTVYSYTYTKKD